MRRTIAAPVVALLLAASLVGCGGDGDGSGGARPSLSPTRSATREPVEPSGSESAEPPEETSPEGEGSAEPEPSRSPTRQPESSDQPGDSSEQSDQQSSEPTSESGEGTVDEATDDTTPTWVWWLLAAIVLGAGVVALVLLRRGRRRAAWQQGLSDAEGELGWLARELLPGLRRAGSREQVAGGWTVASPRVTAAEDALTVLESTAYDDRGRDRARALRDACRLARVRVEELVAPGLHETWALDLDAIMADLDAALGPPRPSAP